MLLRKEHLLTCQQKLGLMMEVVGGNDVKSDEEFVAAEAVGEEVAVDKIDVDDSKAWLTGVLFFFFFAGNKTLTKVSFKKAFCSDRVDSGVC